MIEKKKELSDYRMKQSKETLIVSKECYAGKHYKEAKEQIEVAELAIKEIESYLTSI